MKQRHYIQFNALLLLLLYLFSNSCFTLLHHHHQHSTAVIAYEDATSCEKSIYYPEQAGGCNHKTHISGAFDSCSLCDHHTVSPHTLQITLTACFTREIQTGYIQVSENYFSQTPATYPNRGPPLVSSLMV